MRISKLYLSFELFDYANMPSYLKLIIKMILELVYKKRKIIIISRFHF